MTTRFQPGQPVLYRGPHVDDSGTMGSPVICDVKPMVVVEDSSERVALFLPAGTETLMSRPVLAAQPKPWGPGEWELVAGSWDRWNTLFLHIPGEWRATWVMWTPEWQFLGWYVNLQEPLWRTCWGFDIRDLQLDILVGPDRTWRWNDEDDFQRSIDCGLISAEHAGATRDSAAEAIGAIESKSPPFDGSFSGWRPDSGWQTPALPEGGALAEVLVWAEADCLGRC